MKYNFHPDAKLELEKAIQFFDTCRKDLGKSFLHEIDSSIKRILEYPKAWSKLSENTRRCRINRFPYGIIFTIRNGEILIIAIMHLHRKPGYWKDRLV